MEYQELAVGDAEAEEAAASFRAYEERKYPILRFLRAPQPDLEQFPDALLYASASPWDRGRLVVMFPHGDEESHDFFDRLEARGRVEIGFGRTYYHQQDEDFRNRRLVAAGEGRPLTPTLGGGESTCFLAEEDAAVAEVRRQRSERTLAKMRAKAHGKVHAAPSLTPRSFAKADLGYVLGWCRGRREHYISQHTFSGYRRTVDAVHQLTSLWVDLDFYSPKFKLTPALIQLLDDDIDAVGLVHDVCFGWGSNDEHGWTLPALPLPTMIVRSGRGLYVKWIFDHFLPRTARGAWDAAAAALCSRFVKLGVDAGARDAARILRVVGSVNSKSPGLPVRVIFNGKRTSFDYMADVLLPRRQLSQQDRGLLAQAMKHFKKSDRARAAECKKAREKYELRGAELAAQAHARPRRWGGWPGFVSDLRTLISMRMKRDGNCDGNRERFVFWITNLEVKLKRITTPDGYWTEAAAVARSVGATLDQVREHLTLPKVLGGLGGGKDGDGYRVSKKSLIDLFGITEGERMVLPSLLTDVVPRTKRVRERVKDLDSKVHALANAGVLRPQIKVQLQVSDRTLQRVLARHRGASGH